MVEGTQVVHVEIYEARIETGSRITTAPLQNLVKASQTPTYATRMRATAHIRTNAH
ncbi:hypothetical protein PTKU46_07060 [Paraburkholderia terrae]